MNTMVEMKVHRGEVWWTDLGQTKGSEQGGVRPVLVVSNDKCNRFSTTVTVVPLTTKNKTNIPTHVPMEAEYLKGVNIALVEQITTIDKVRLIEVLGRASREIMIEIDKAIAVQNGLKNEFENNKAYEMAYQIVNINNAIRQAGKLDPLLTARSYLIKEFKAYCDLHKVDYKEYFRQNSTKIENNFQSIG